MEHPEVKFGPITGYRCYIMEPYNTSLLYGSVHGAFNYISLFHIKVNIKMFLKYIYYTLLIHKL